MNVKSNNQLLCSFSFENRCNKLKLKFMKKLLLIFAVFVSLNTWAQIQILGTVSDADGPLPGATVVVKGTSTGVTTDFDGNFSIQAAGDDTLVVSYVGFQSQEVAVGSQTNISVVLNSNNELDEVVLIGYGSSTKRDITGSVGVVNAESIEQRISTNPLDNIQGKVAGLNVFNSSGRPGGGMRVTIRGKGSINASNQPLYVIDGIIGVDIELVNTNDIESISVLKDASATAIYGSRGANGVIIVTTKKGRKGKLSVDYTSNLQVSSLTNKPEVLNSQEFWKDLKVRVDADDRALGRADDTFVGDYPAEYPEFFTSDGTTYGSPRFDTDWLDESTRTSISSQHFVNVRAGGDNHSVSFSAGTQDDEGIMQNTYLNKNTMRLHGDFQVNDWLEIGGSMSYADTKTNIVDDYRIGADNITMATLFYAPIYPTKYDDGTAVNANDLMSPVFWDIWYGATPKERINLLNRETIKKQITRNVFAEIDLAENLKFRSSYSILDFITESKNHIHKRIDTFVNRTSASLSNSNAEQTLFENLLTYNTTINSNHEIGAMLGASWQENEAFAFGLSTQDFDDFFGYYNVGQGSDTPVVNSNYSKYNTNSYFGRFNYSYMDKYLITATGRYDGSSRFGDNNKYAFFPSAAIAWKISNEPFMTDSNVISNLKLRASVGETGNDGIGNYARIASPATQNVVFNDTRVIGSSQGSIGNDDLRWERTTESNIGLDFNLFNRVDISTDYYTKTTKDLLFNVPIAQFSGYGFILGNAGSVKNSGIELLISSTNIKTDSFVWTSSFNFTKNNNEILSLGEEDKDIFTASLWWNDQILRVGESVGSFWGYTRLGTWGINEVAEAAEYNAIPGDIKWEDVNGDGLINFDDQKIIGNGQADYTMNIGNTFSYKNWDLSVDIRISQGNDIMDHSVILYVDRMGYGNTYKKFYDQSWTPDNQNTMYPRVRKNIKKFDGADSGQVFDGSFIRGQNLSLSYNFNTDFLETINLESAQIYFNLQNFFLITDYHGYDPEVSTFGGQFNDGIELNGYPKAMNMNLGIRVNL